jgi:enoyl-[acyl-carrier protein] reductase I
MTIPVYPDTKVALKGRKGLVVGIANDQSIAWGCARAFRALGADLAVTYLNERARKHVEPLAKELEAAIFMPLDVNIEGQLEQVFERIEREWGQLDFLLHSIAFSPKEALHGRVVDVGRDGFHARPRAWRSCAVVTNAANVAAFSGSSIVSPLQASGPV